MSMLEHSPAFRFAVLTLFPEAFTALTEWGVTGRAFQNGLCQLHLQDPRLEATDRHGSVDDRPYGGGPGMVMGCRRRRQGSGLGRGRAVSRRPKPRTRA